MSNTVYSPSITVARNRRGLDTQDENDVLISSTRSGVIGFSYNTKGTEFIIRCLDPDGNVMRKIGSWDIADGVADHLSQESGIDIATAKLIWKDPLYVRLTDGVNRPSINSAFIMGISQYVDERDQHIVEVRLAATTFQQTRKSLLTAGDYTGSDKRFNTGSTLLGTYKLKGSGYGTIASYNIDIEKVISGIEDLLEVPSRTDQNDTIVILGNDTIDALRKIKDGRRAESSWGIVGLGERTQIITVPLSKILTNELGFSLNVRDTGANEGSLYLMDTEGSVDDDTVSEGASVLNKGVQYALKKLKKISAELEVTDMYDSITFTDPEFVDQFRVAFEGQLPEFPVGNLKSSTTIIAPKSVVASFSTKEGVQGLQSSRGKILQEIGNQLFNIQNRAIQSSGPDQMTKLFDGGHLLELRMNAMNPNVLSITHNQEHGMSLALLLDSFNIAGVSKEKAMSKEEVEEFVDAHIATNLLQIPNIVGLQKMFQERYIVNAADTKVFTKKIASHLNSFADTQVGRGIDRRGLLVYLQYIIARWATDATKLVVKTPPMFNMTGMHFLTVPATMKHAMSKTTVTDKRDIITGDNPFSWLNGVYQIVNIKHQVSQSSAYSEFTIVKIPVEIDPPEVESISNFTIEDVDFQEGYTKGRQFVDPNKVEEVETEVVETLDVESYNDAWRSVNEAVNGPQWRDPNRGGQTPRQTKDPKFPF